MSVKNVCLTIILIATAGGCASHDSSPARLSSQDHILDVYLPGEQWKPTNEEATEAKAALLAYLASGALPAGESPRSSTAVYRPIVAAHIGSYALQYFGGYLWIDGHVSPDPSGEKAIWINGVCKGPWLESDDIAKHLINVNDGGACFFHAMYSTAQRKILELSINGDA